VRRQVNRAGLLDIVGESGDINIQEEKQQKLDVCANEKFKNALETRGDICGLASEEDESFVGFSSREDGTSKYVVVIDPIDGSSNIDVNIPIGTIFGVYRRLSPNASLVLLNDLLQRGSVQVAAGYIIYGSSAMLVYTTGDGVNGFTFDASISDYFLSHENMKHPENGNIYSINEGNYAKFSPSVKECLDFCKSQQAETNRPYVLRYVGSLVSDFHRNLIKCGVFICPGLKDAPTDKLRLLCECNPLAFIAEQAGGKASDVKMRILDKDPVKLHQRSPLIIGPTHFVEEVEAFMKNAVTPITKSNAKCTAVTQWVEPKLVNS
jgi:fructose-1,6-bisphosphatase I